MSRTLKHHRTPAGHTSATQATARVNQATRLRMGRQAHMPAGMLPYEYTSAIAKQHIRKADTARELREGMRADHRNVLRQRTLLTNCAIGLVLPTAFKEWGTMGALFQPYAFAIAIIVDYVIATYIKRQQY